MPDLWFVAGLAMGIVMTAFFAVTSFDRGADSVRRRTWMSELAARQRAITKSHTAAHASAPRNVEAVA